LASENARGLSTAPSFAGFKLVPQFTVAGGGVKQATGAKRRGGYETDGLWHDARDYRYAGHSWIRRFRYRPESGFNSAHYPRGHSHRRKRWSSSTELRHSGGRQPDHGRRAAGQVQIPAGAEINNASGKYVLPGLWDAQVNYAWYWGEVMLNQSVTSTVDIGDGERSRSHSDHVRAVGLRQMVGIGHLGGIRGNTPATGLGYHSWYATTFLGGATDRSVVYNLAWTQALKQASFRQRNGGGGNIRLPDPTESPQPAIESNAPVMIARGSPATAVASRGLTSSAIRGFPPTVCPSLIPLYRPELRVTLAQIC
jgi:hypothetical protein